MSVAKAYARALYETATDQKLSPEFFDHVEVQMDHFLSFLEKWKDGKVLLFSSMTSTREKIGMIQEFSKKLDFSPLLTQFMILLIQKKRLSLFKEIRTHFGVVRLTLEGGVPGRLVSAEPMSESDIGVLARAFSQKLGKKVAFQVSTDPFLLAGMKVTVNGVTYDGTLRSQLQKLRDRFVNGLAESQT
jgi:F-type H+-transporting ATPase subunit delta